MGADHYAERQDERNREYRREVDAWIASLNPAEIAELKARGIIHERRLRNGTTVLVAADCGDTPASDVCREDDASTLFENSTVTATWDPTPDSLADFFREEFGVDAGQAERLAEWHQQAVRLEAERESSSSLQRIIGFFLQCDNLRLAAHALAHAAHMAKLNGLRSLRHSAEICGVSPEGLRKVVNKWTALLGLPPIEGAKSDEAKKRYSENAKNNHWRKQLCSMGKLNPNTKA